MTRVHLSVDLTLLPFGFIAPVLHRMQMTFQRTMALALATSAAIELAQVLISLMLGFAYRVASVDDVLLNLVGACAGYLAYRAVRPWLEQAAWNGPAQRIESDACEGE